MKKIVIDTNALLRFLLNDIPEQKDIVTKLIVQAKQNKVILIIPEIVPFEIDFILRKNYKISKEEIIDKLKSLLSAEYFQILQKEILKKAINIWSKENISLTDSFLMSFTEEENASLFTFDKKLSKIINSF